VSERGREGGREKVADTRLIATTGGAIWAIDLSSWSSSISFNAWWAGMYCPNCFDSSACKAANEPSFACCFTWSAARVRTGLKLVVTRLLPASAAVAAHFGMRAGLC